MAKVRVYELAKEFGVESKAVMAKLEEMGEFVRSASSTIEAPVVRRLKEQLNGGSAKPGRGAVARRQAAATRAAVIRAVRATAATTWPGPGADGAPAAASAGAPGRASARAAPRPRAGAGAGGPGRVRARRARFRPCPA